jgi:hypothetical protein
MFEPLEKESAKKSFELDKKMLKLFGHNAYSIPSL